MPASFKVTLFDQAQTVADPSIAQRGVESDCGFESVLGIFEVIFTRSREIRAMRARPGCAAKNSDLCRVLPLPPKRDPG